MTHRQFQHQTQTQHEQCQQEAIEHEQSEVKLLAEYQELNDLLEHYKCKERQWLQWLQQTKSRLETAFDEHLPSAHTNLTTILATLELFRQGNLGTLNDQQRAFINSACEAAQGIDEYIEKSYGLVDLINDFIRFLGMEPVNLQHIAHEVALSAREDAIAKGLQFAIEIAPHLPLIFAHPGQIRSVLDHVLSHAITFTEQGEVRLCIQHAEEGIQITISDTGIGMTAKELEQIFETTFCTRDQPLSACHGLGLISCQGIVKCHKGRLWIESERHKGTTVYMLLPSINTVLGTDTG